MRNPFAKKIIPGSIRPNDGADGIFDPKSGEQGMYLGVTVPAGRLRLFSALAGLALLILIGRAFSLQVVSGGKYLNLAENNRTRIVRDPAVRGIFFDSADKPLVANAPSFAVTITAADLPVEPERLNAVAAALTRYGISSEEWSVALATARKSPFEAVTVASRLSYEQAISLTVESAELSGVSVRVTTERNYLPAGEHADSLAHVLGFVGRISPEEYARLKDNGYYLNDRLGKTGLEAALEPVLRGTSGSRQIEVDAFGRERRIVSAESPENGANVRLTLNLDAQVELERLLVEELHAIGRKRAAAVVLDPRDGSVIAMVSLPAYDPNLFTRGVSNEEYAALSSDPDRPLFPRASAGQYPSGSTFKPVVAIAALAEKVITPATTVLSTGGIWYNKTWFFPDWKAGGHGLTNVYKAIAESVNTFFYTIGGGTDKFTGLGPERIATYAKLFGFGETTGLDLPGEATGLIPTPAWRKVETGKEWYIGDTYHMAIGQGDVLVTPLQVAEMAATIANGGKLWQPHFLSAVYDPGAKTWKKVQPKLNRDNTNLKEAIAVIQKAMRMTVTSGVARSLQNVVVPVAGKTGTAQWTAENKPTHAWFAGFAPADKPTVAIAILIEEGGEGSSVAVPVAGKFLNWYFTVGQNASVSGTPKLAPKTPKITVRTTSTPRLLPKNP